MNPSDFILYFKTNKLLKGRFIILYNYLKNYQKIHYKIKLKNYDF